MTRQEHLEYCTTCLNKSFDPKSGIVCKLTSKIADFEDSCKDYVEDIKEVEKKNLQKEELKKDDKKSINTGRIVLFILAGAYIILGIYEGFYINFHDIIFAIIDWIIAGCFIGLAIWSFRKPYHALIIGLILYLMLVILLAVIEPLSIFSGLIWKVMIVFYLVYAIKTSKNEKIKVKYEGDDLLDN